MQILMLKIDSHTHILPKKMPNWSEKFGYGDFIYLQHHKKGFAKMMRGNQFFREIKENCWNAELRIKEYAPFKTQVQVICTIPVMFSYWAKSLDCLSLSQFLNDHIAKLVDRAITEVGAAGMQDMGKVIGIIKQKTGASADGSIVARLVKEKLSA